MHAHQRRVVDELLHLRRVPYVSLPESDVDVLINGRIDRVDEVNLPYDLIDKDDAEIIPLDFELDKPPKSKRLVVIRDIKSVDGSKDNDDHKRHMKSIFQELQLALYARAWEISHPGDLVVGVGISLFSHNTSHNLETSNVFPHINKLNIGIISRITEDLYRFPNEDNNPDSDQFRAWLTHRLSVSLGVANNATLGKVHPTPSKKVCTYCSVKQICDVKMEGDF